MPRDASPGTFYSAMSNIDLEIGEGNPGAVGLRARYAQHCYDTSANGRMNLAEPNPLEKFLQRVHHRQSRKVRSGAITNGVESSGRCSGGCVNHRPKQIGGRRGDRLYNSR